ncbi:MAG: AAA family ATPase, partial [Armatimonadota bacterium]|nr:AAA family ATPase [Armatimonadota bacterium]
MILREISVKGVKCFRDEVTIGRFGDGLNMLFGPNETGKSTLIEATARALFDGYTITGDAIEDLRPWETTLAPEIALEFEARGELWRLEKRLLSGPECILSRMETSRWSRLHERDAADEFVRELMHGDAPGRGPSDLRHWGLARTLWCLNDPCMLGKAEAACVVPTAVAGQIRNVLGEGTVATALEAVSERLEDRYDEYFTPTTARPRAGSPIEALREEIEQLEEQRAEAEQELQQVEAAAERLEALRAKAEGLDEERERLQTKIAEYRDEAEQVAAVQQEIEGIEKDLQRAVVDRKEMRADLERLGEARDTAEEAREELTEVTRSLADVQAELKTAQQLVDEAQEEHRETQAERKRVALRLEAAHKTEQALSLLEERQSLAELLANIGELAEQRDALEQRLQEMPCPDDDEIERADSLQRQIERLQAQLETAGLTVTVEARREQEVALSGGEEELRETVAEGDEVSYTAGSTVRIDLPDVALISVRSGASEPAELQAELEEAREEQRALLAPYRADDSAALRDLQHEHERLTEDLNRHDERIQQAADPWEGPDEIEQRQTEIRMELTRLLNELELTEDELAGVDRPDVVSLEDTLRSVQANEDAIQDRLDGRRKRAEELADKREKLRDERAGLEAAIGEHQATVTGVLERYDCDDEDALRSDLDVAEREVDALETKLAEEREKLPSEEMDPQRLLETAEQALEEVSEREIELAGQRGDSQGII